MGPLRIHEFKNILRAAVLLGREAATIPPAFRFVLRRRPWTIGTTAPLVSYRRAWYTRTIVLDALDSEHPLWQKFLLEAYLPIIAEIDRLKAAL